MKALNENNFNELQKSCIRELRSTAKACKLASKNGSSLFTYLYCEVERLTKKAHELGIKLV